MNKSREGLYAWLSVNFMNNTLKNFNNTIAVLDLRDSSLQIIFYLPPENLQNYEAKFVKQFTIMGIERHFYNQSGSSPKDDIYNYCWSAVLSLIANNVNKVTIKQPIMAIPFFMKRQKKLI
ncbi:uncharacterized protein LOC112591772 [Melanaphis sacchari]|uniref:uncharacterized protein LOC112591772 n=1 Tax=Melanaphis sacchari TaxID=742174 RepID=UPI000DC14ADC|nr:uncharacterized protein LOC112591772 [Melanaphis sacchari]